MPAVYICLQTATLTLAFPVAFALACLWKTSKRALDRAVWKELRMRIKGKKMMNCSRHFKQGYNKSWLSPFPSSLPAVDLEKIQVCVVNNDLIDTVSDILMTSIWYVIPSIHSWAVYWMIKYPTVHFSLITWTTCPGSSAATLHLFASQSGWLSLCYPRQCCRILCKTILKNMFGRSTLFTSMCSRALWPHSRPRKLAWQVTCSGLTRRICVDLAPLNLYEHWRMQVRSKPRPLRISSCCLQSRIGKPVLGSAWSHKSTTSSAFRFSWLSLYDSIFWPDAPRYATWID